MALRKYIPSSDAPTLSVIPLNLNNRVHEKAQFAEPDTAGSPVEADVDIDLREVYFLIMHFLSAGPCHRTYGQFWNELLEHQLLPRRYHAWYSRHGACSGDENDNGLSFPLSYNKLVERYPHVGKDHLVKLLKQLILSTSPPSHGMVGGNVPNAADVPTLLGSGPFSLLESDRKKEDKQVSRPPNYLRWPHMLADQVHGLGLREIGGGFTKHHRAPSIRAACYAIAKPSTMVQKMENIKKLRGHRDAVYCAIFDRSGRYVITGSDDRLVKIWSMETAFCLASCRGHEGDITDLAVSSNNALVASASNDFIIRVWRLPDGVPISVLRGHTGAVTAIAFSPRLTSNYVYNLLSSSDDGTCRIWDARSSQSNPRIYLPKPPDTIAGKSNGPSSSTGPQNHQILCCAYNASGTVFVTGSSDTYARVWNACKFNSDDSEQPNHEMDVLSGHENDVNYVQFSGCAVASRSSTTDTSKEENIPKFKNSWFTQDYIVTCSRDGSAIIWIPRSRRSHGRAGRWSRAYHLKVPPPPMPPQPPRGGPRQRFLPTPRGVNMIVWSLDNRFVLAAIMDCRICVWNAIDGSLVHSLTGHSESTYVLDVHPFNPRIAMSAGYDGKTIVWDIWEGTPIRIYETGRFKLVDGKFSPDGTSIVLSDDVGQIYILTTGQGESQKDSKYDQFFLGDYRPLIQDTHGNVLDQETQLLPHRRNFQDLLCDASMIPYPEPYQSMYQQRRLGALGIEWHPSSVKFAVGPADINGFQDYQMLPLIDLDRIIEPLPEFLEAMDWEPEIEAQSEDNDSEYNVTDECSSEGGQGKLSTSSSGDPGSSAEDSDAEQSHKDGLRRSKRKKHKGEVELMTSSGRRVKRRNLDERDGTLSRSDRSKKSKSGRKAKRRKSSTSKSLRPQRVAARNALNLFSRITGASTDEEDEGSESDSFDSETLLLADSNIESNESDRSMQNVQHKNLKGKEVSLDESEDVFKAIVLPDSQANAGNRRRLVLKLPARDSKKLVPLESTRVECEKFVDFVGTSSKAPQETIVLSRNHVSSQVQRTSSGDLIHVLQPCGSENGIHMVGDSVKVEEHLNLSAGYRDNKIRWGEVKTRTSKRFRSDAAGIDTCPGFTADLDDHIGLASNVNLHLKPERPHDVPIDSELQKHGIETVTEDYIRVGTAKGLDVVRNQEFTPPADALERLPTEESLLRKGTALVSCNGNRIKECKEQTGPSFCKDYDEPLERIGMVADDKTTFKFSVRNGSEHSQELKESIPRISKLRIKSRTLLRGSDSPSKLNSITAVEDFRSSGCDSQGPSNMSQCLISGGPVEDEGTSTHRLDNEDENDLGYCEPQSEQLSSLQGAKMMHSDTNNRMYSAVYKRSKTYRARSNSEGDGGGGGGGGGMEESTSNASNHNPAQLMDFPEASTDGIRRTRSMGMKTAARDIANSNFKAREGHGSVETSRRAEKFGVNIHDQLIHEEWRSSPKINVGLRSARNRRGNNTDSPVDKRKSHHTIRKLSWLMLSEHEESYRYIPQQGDDVVYLRQGHQEYIEWRQSSEVVPWRSLKNLRAVEFCKVVGLDYSTLAGSGESCCKMKLQLVDALSSEFGETFYLTLSELNDFSDFVVERTRYDAAINRNWTHRDKCQVWWRNESGEGGSWWDGRISFVKPKSPEFPESPWERYGIHYKSDPESHLHSPWELHDPDILWEHPHIDEHTRSTLLASFAKLEQSRNSIHKDYFGIQKLNQVSQKSEFLNRFPAPLSFEMIHLRLERNYYRSLEAVKHDFAVMLSNAYAYFDKKNLEVRTKMRRLSDWFDKTMSPLLATEVL